jgi:hypothetical protein
MHERYMFTGLMLLAPLIAYRRLRLLYFALSVLFIANTSYAFTIGNLENHARALDLKPWYKLVSSAEGRGGFSLLVTVTVAYAVWKSFGWLPRGERPSQVAVETATVGRRTT